VALVGAFTVVAVISGPRSERSSFDSYQGLAARSPLLAALLALFMLGLAGFPLTAGFVGKVSVFGAAAEAGYLWLAVVALVVAVAGLYFYLRVIVLMYFSEPVLAEAPGTATASPRLDGSDRVVLGIAAAVTLGLGLVPWPLLELVRNALPV
jgi:NADH-quinone oxidoreductase subunit N